MQELRKGVAVDETEKAKICFIKQFSKTLEVKIKN